MEKRNSMRKGCGCCGRFVLGWIAHADGDVHTKVECFLWAYLLKIVKHTLTRGRRGTLVIVNAVFDLI